MESQLSPASAGRDQQPTPHRGGTVLALGVLDLLLLIAVLFFAFRDSEAKITYVLGLLVTCGLIVLPLGLVAWFMASRDLRAMNAGEMDSSGRTPTQVGRVLGLAAAAIMLLVAGSVLALARRSEIERREKREKLLESLR